MHSPDANDTSLIYVCIPAHNEEKFIGTCLGSIKKAAAQIKPANVEIVVCNLQGRTL